MYAAIMSTNAGRVTKYQRFETREEAQAFVSERTDRYPDAVVVQAPNADVRDWVVTGNSVVVQPDPERIARKEAAKASVEARTAALARGTGNVTRAEVEAIKDVLREVLT